MRRDYIDFHAIAERHETIHVRLQNWARSLHGGNRPRTAPGFDGYQSPPSVRREAETSIPVDQGDARRIAAGVSALPEKHRKALQWSYVLRSSVLSGRKYLGVTASELDRLVVDGRDMLCNRGI